MKRTMVLWMAWLVFGLSASGFAQGVQTGTIRGIGEGPAGLAGPGVTVTATSSALQGPRTTVTDADGRLCAAATCPPATTRSSSN